MSLIYRVQHSHIFQAEASVPASVAPLMVDTEYDEPYHRIFKILFTKHPQYQWLEFTVRHYTIVSEYYMEILEPL